MAAWHSRTKCPVCAGTGENEGSALKMCDVCLSLGYMYKPSEAFRELGQTLGEQLKRLEKSIPGIPVAVVIDLVTDIDRFVKEIDRETDPEGTLNDTLASDIRKGYFTRYLAQLKKTRDAAVAKLRQQGEITRPSQEAFLQAMLGNYDLAETLFAQCLSDHAENGLVHYDYGTYLMCFKRQYREAMWHLESAMLGNAPTRASLYLAAADCASEIGSHGKAQVYYLMCSIADDFAKLDQEARARVELEVVTDGSVN